MLTIAPTVTRTLSILALLLVVIDAIDAIVIDAIDVLERITPGVT